MPLSTLTLIAAILIPVFSADATQQGGDSVPQVVNKSSNVAIPVANPTERLNNRLDSRLNIRVDSRILGYHDVESNARTAIAAADEELRHTNRER